MESLKTTNTNYVSQLHGRSLQDILAAYAQSVGGDEECRTGVWKEHSYARAFGSAAHSHVRVLLSPRATSPQLGSDDEIDVTSVPSEPPELPYDTIKDNNVEEDTEPDNWEERLRALASSGAHARLADEVVEILRALRLERLSGACSGRWSRRESCRLAARRLRRLLSAHWAGGAVWLHSALGAHLPRPLRALYMELLPELRRAVPRLVARLPLTLAIDLVRDPFSTVPDQKSAKDPGPWLVWAPSGCKREDRRWTRRLGAHLHTRVLHSSVAATSPVRWCASIAEGARTALAELRKEAGDRMLILGGFGSGSTLASWLAVGTRVRGLLLLAPPLLTAEGVSDADAPLTSMLAVVGGSAATGGRNIGSEMTARGGQLLLLAGVDDALRLPPRHRRRLRLPQEALDAAVAEECARWITDLAETPEPSPAARSRRIGAASDDEISTMNMPGCSVEAVEGRVVRVSGATPLTLRPRCAPLAPVDILQLPIVFADDTLASPAPVPARSRLPSPVLPAPRRGRGGRGGRGGHSGRHSRVLVAKRGRRPGSALLQRRAMM